MQNSGLDERCKAGWQDVPQLLREAAVLGPHWEAIFGPIRTGAVDDLLVIGQMGQSLDGRVATANGHSHYINGSGGLTHLHQLRALVDAVVVGVGTANADDPQLTVRRVSGPSPARVVIDPGGRLADRRRLLADDGVRRIVVTASGGASNSFDAEVIGIPVSEGGLAPSAILTALAERGMRRILIEGGPNTVSRFLASGCIDRLHVVVSPIILGSGRPGFTLDPIDRLDKAMRPPVQVHALDGEVLYDCDMSAYRVPVWRAKKSECPTVIEDLPAAT